MLDLQPIKDRLALASPDRGRRVGYPPDADLKNNAHDDLAALVAEVERLRADVQLYKGRIAQHKEATARYGGPNTPDNKLLWEVLNA